ncbi:hypothetical protein [Viridibacillus soli]|nr:hypothetical protein [Viridibacillus soli]
MLKWIKKWKKRMNWLLIIIKVINGIVGFAAAVATLYIILS